MGFYCPFILFIAELKNDFMISIVLHKRLKGLFVFGE